MAKTVTMYITIDEALLWAVLDKINNHIFIPFVGPNDITNYGWSVDNTPIDKPKNDK